MKRIVPILVAAVVFGWMLLSGAVFLSENPGGLGFLANPARGLLGLAGPTEPPEALSHHHLRVAYQIKGSLASRWFNGLPAEAVGALGVSLGLFVAFVGSGLWALRFLGARQLLPIEAFPVAAGLGLGIWGIMIFVIGAVGLLYPTVLVCAVILVAVISAPQLLQLARDFAAQRSNKYRRAAGAPNGPRGSIEWIAICLAASAVGLCLLYALTPAIQSDGLRYHLSAPQAYLQEHRIVYLPFNAFTNFPFLIEMLFTLAMGLAGDMAAKMIHFECFLLCGLFVMLLTSRLLDNLDSSFVPHPSSFRLLPLLAALVFWATPTVLIVGAWEFVDLGTALFFTAMVYALVRSQKCSQPHAFTRPDSSFIPHPSSLHYDQAVRWRWIAALFLGFLIGTKYTMLVMVVALPIALAIGSHRRDFSAKSWLRSSSAMVAIAVAVASPWFIKNTIYTRNPIYPLAWQVFDGGEWSAENDEFYRNKSSAKGHHPHNDRSLVETLRNVVATPWDATLYWRAYEGHFLGPVFLLWLPLLLRVIMDVKHRTPRQGPLRLVVFFALAYCTVWYFTYQSNRLLIPALALLSVLVAYSLAVVGQTARWIAKVGCVVLLAASAYNIEWAASWIASESSGPDLPPKPSAAAYLLGFQSRDSYLCQAFPPYAIFQQMPDHVATGEKVLFVGDYRACHCPVEWLASDWFDTPLLLRHIRTTPDNDSLLDQLLDQGVRCVFYNDAEWARYEKLFFEGGYEKLILDSDKQVALKARFTAEEKARYLGLFRRDKSGTVVAHPRLNAVAMQKDPQSGLWMILYETRRKAEGKRQKLE